MTILNKFLLAICLSIISSSSICVAASPAPTVEAIAEVYGDGIALSTVILDYDQPIKASSVNVADFSVPGRNITQAAAMIVPDCHIYYTLYNRGGHRSTWQHAYDLLPAMEWIFAQHK